MESRQGLQPHKIGAEQEMPIRWNSHFGVMLFLLIAVTSSAAERDFLPKQPWADLLQMDLSTTSLSKKQTQAARKEIWQVYSEAVKGDPRRGGEHRDKGISFKGKTMRYTYSTVGKPGDSGYPLYIALHGGGGGPARMNDGQYQHMKRYYLPTVKRGIYLAPRGVTNTWNLHFVEESYVCYDRLIENMIVFENVDPNRVYILGFSAGGDGVYQIAARMADRWAAANMSAGHHNGVSPRNLYNTPFLIQVGEHDAAYKRNSEAVKFAAKLQQLQKSEAKGYVHQINVHVGRGHNFYDHHPQQAPQQVLAEPGAWLKGGKSKRTARNTSTIAWLDTHVRTPQPPRVIWDLATGAERTAAELWSLPVRGKQRYWLDVAGLKGGEGEIAARLVKTRNAVVVESMGDQLRLLLSDAMLDLDEPVAIEVGGTVKAVQVKRTLGNLLRTLAGRGDPTLMFDASLVINRTPDSFTIAVE
jgi:acetyl esterase/lipase